MGLLFSGACCCALPYPDSAVVEIDQVQGQDDYFAYEIGTHFGDDFIRYAVVTGLYRAPEIAGAYELIPLADTVDAGIVTGRILQFSGGVYDFFLRLQINSSTSNVPFSLTTGFDSLVRFKLSYGTDAQPSTMEQMLAEDWPAPVSRANFLTDFFVFNNTIPPPAAGQVPDQFLRIVGLSNLTIREQCAGGCEGLVRTLVFPTPSLSEGIFFDPPPAVSTPFVARASIVRSRRVVGLFLFTDRESHLANNTIPTNFLIRPLIGDLGTGVAPFEYSFRIKTIELTHDGDSVLPLPKP